MKTTSLLLFISLLLISCKVKTEEAQKKVVAKNLIQPNVLFIAVDDLRPELGFYGSTHVKSPNLDKLANTSTVFERAYCNVPTCGASRVSLLTGTRPTRYRFLRATANKDKESPETISLPMIFKNNGYTTISNGKIYHTPDDDVAAWDEIWTPDGDKFALAINKMRNKGERGMPYESAEVPDDFYNDGKIALKALEDLRKLKNANKPFFLGLGFHKPHLPFTAPKKYWDLYDVNSIVLPENYTQPSSTPSEAFHNFGELRNYTGIPKKGLLGDIPSRNLIHGYYAAVSYIDTQIGLVLDELDKLGLAENTIIVVWGDHGWNLGDHQLWCKHCTFNSSIHSPLVIKIPRQIKGSSTKTITEFIDIYPTLCDLAGIEKPEQLEGESLVSLLEGQKTDTRTKKYAISKFLDAVAIVKENFIYTEWINNEGKAYARMLFDQKKDPLEIDNLAEKKAYQEMVRELSVELRKKWGKDFFKPINMNTDEEK